jgi:hypothetical protein
MLHTDTAACLGVSGCLRSEVAQPGSPWFPLRNNASHAVDWLCHWQKPSRCSAAKLREIIVFLSQACTYVQGTLPYGKSPRPSVVVCTRDLAGVSLRPCVPLRSLPENGSNWEDELISGPWEILLCRRESVRGAQPIGTANGGEQLCHCETFTGI